MTVDQQNLMNEQKIIRYFQKADNKFLGDLQPEERSQAVEEFNRLLIDQKEKVSIVLNRRKKVNINRAEQEQELNNQTKLISQNLRNRINMHIKKREKVQLEKLNSYKNMENRWKERIKLINEQSKEELKKKVQKYKQISKEVEDYWSKKCSPKSSQTKFNSVKLQQKQPQIYFQESRYKQNNPQSAKFMTEPRYSLNKKNPEIMVYENKTPLTAKEFPQINEQRMKKVERKVSKSVNVQRIATEGCNNVYILKSRQQWRAKEDNNFQSAMEKIDKIFKARIKVRQNFKQQIRKVKQYNSLKQENFSNKRKYNSFDRSQQIKIHSSHQMHHESQESSQIVVKKNSTPLRDQEQIVKLRRIEKQQMGFQSRQRLFQQEKQRQRRGKMFRLVHEALNIHRLQALRQKQ